LVEEIRAGTLVTVTVISPVNNIVAIDQISVNNYGEFSTVYDTEGDLWKYDGTYTIRVQYGNQAVSNKALVELTGGILPSFDITTPYEMEQEDEPVNGSNPVCEFMTEINVDGSKWKFDGTYIVTARHGQNNLYTISLPVEIVDGKTLATHVSDDLMVNIVYTGDLERTKDDDADQKRDFDQNRDFQGMRFSLTADEGSTIILAKGETSNVTPISIIVTGPQFGNILFVTTVSCMDVNDESPPEPTPEQRIPDWIRNIFIWYGDGLISEDELIDALRFLIQEGTIQV